MTCCVNKAISSGTFPFSLKLTNIVPVHKDIYPTYKCNYRPVSVLAVLSKASDKILFDQSSI